MQSPTPRVSHWSFFAHWQISTWIVINALNALGGISGVSKNTLKTENVTPKRMLQNLTIVHDYVHYLPLIYSLYIRRDKGSSNSWNHLHRLAGSPLLNKYTPMNNWLSNHYCWKLKRTFVCQSTVKSSLRQQTFVCQSTRKSPLRQQTQG
jgi:hypothetical protein